MSRQEQREYVLTCGGCGNESAMVLNASYEMNQQFYLECAICDEHNYLTITGRASRPLRRNNQRNRVQIQRRRLP